MDPTSLWVTIMCISLLARIAKLEDRTENYCSYQKEKDDVQCISVDVPHCIKGWMYYQNSKKCYTEEKRTWKDAKDDCKSQGARLAAAISVEEIAYLNKRRQGSAVIWLNGNSAQKNEAGNWVWMDEPNSPEVEWGLNGGAAPADAYVKEHCVGLEITNMSASTEKAKMSPKLCTDIHSYVCVRNKGNIAPPSPKKEATPGVVEINLCRKAPVVIVVTVAVVLFLQLLALLTCTAVPVLWRKFKIWRKNRKKFWSFMAKQEERKRTMLSEEDQDTKPDNAHANLPPSGPEDVEESLSFSTRQKESAKSGPGVAESVKSN